MARQLSEQLEREVNAEELLKRKQINTKAGPAAVDSAAAARRAQPRPRRIAPPAPRAGYGRPRAATHPRHAMHAPTTRTIPAPPQ